MINYDLQASQVNAHATSKLLVGDLQASQVNAHKRKSFLTQPFYRKT
jgi:hypothetical protein